MASVKATAKEATQTVEAIAADTQKAAQEQFNKITDGVEKLTVFNQQNFDALVKSSEVATKAAEGITTELSAFSKRAFEDSVAAAQDFASAKTVTELFEKQTAYAKTSFDGFIKQTSKFNELFSNSAKEVTKPLNERVSAATDAVKAFSA